MSIYVKTPLKPLTRINEKTGKNFMVKLESYQPDGSFKIRGVSVLCEELKAKGVRRIISSSGGNAGHAAAYCARELGMACTVVIPGSANPKHIRENLDLFGFELTAAEMEAIDALDRGEKHDWY